MLDSSIDSLDLSTRHDARLLEAALRSRWEIGSERKRTIVDKVFAALAQCDPQEHPRKIATLARVLVQMEGQNQADDHRNRPERRLNVNVTPEQLAAMSEEELAALERRLLGRDA